jgi:recombination protein RecA
MKAQEAALGKFEEEFRRSFGPDILARGNPASKHEVIATGSITLDFALGVGGFPLGFMSEIWGPDGVGKTTLGLLAIKQAQAQYPDRMCALIDVEHKLDQGWADKLGVDLRRLWVITPQTAEDVADIVKALLDSKLVVFTVLDSIGAMTNQEEFDKDAGERSVGTTPGIITRMVRIAAALLRPANAHLFLINQVRANLGYGADTTTGGGFARAHATAFRIKARKAVKGEIKLGSGDDAVQVGQRIALKIEKNGLASQGRTAVVTLITQPTEKYGMELGFADPAGEAFDVGKKTGVISRAGANYTLPDGEVIKSEEKVRQYLAERPDLVETIRQEVIALINGGGAGLPGTEADEEPDPRDPDADEPAEEAVDLDTAAETTPEAKPEEEMDV